MPYEIKPPLAAMNPNAPTEGNRCSMASRAISSRWPAVTTCGSTIKPPLGSCAKLVIARSIPSASRMPAAATLTPNDGPASSAARNSATFAAVSGCMRTAARTTPGTISFNISKSFRHTLAGAIFLTPRTLLAVPTFEFFDDVLHWRAHGNSVTEEEGFHELREDRAFRIKWVTHRLLRSTCTFAASGGFVRCLLLQDWEEVRSFRHVKLGVFQNR